MNPLVLLTKAFQIEDILKLVLADYGKAKLRKLLLEGLVTKAVQRHPNVAAKTIRTLMYEALGDIVEAV